MTRRLMGRTAAAGGTLAVLALVAGCADVAEVAEVCASRTDPPVRVDDRVCAAPLNRAEADRFGWYEIQLPPVEYDDDGYGFYPALVVVDVGRPLPRAGTAGAGAFRGYVPAGVTPPRALRPPAKAESSAGATGLTRAGTTGPVRGGLGASSSGSGGS